MTSPADPEEIASVNLDEYEDWTVLAEAFGATVITESYPSGEYSSRLVWPDGRQAYERDRLVIISSDSELPDPVDPVTPGDDAIDLAYNVGHTSMRYDAAAWPMALFHATPKMLAAAAPLLVAEAVAAERAKTANEIADAIERDVLNADICHRDVHGVFYDTRDLIGRIRSFVAGSETTKEDGPYV